MPVEQHPQLCICDKTLSNLPHLRLKGEVDLLRVLAESPGSLPELGNRLVASDSSTPDSSDLLGLVEVVGLGGRDEVGEGLLVLGSDVVNGNDSRGLLAGDNTETGLSLDDDVGDTHLSAEGGQEDNELDGVDVVGDHDELGLLGLDERDNVVETVLGEDGLLRVLGRGLVALLLSLLSLGQETSLLLLGGLGLVLVEELEELGGGVLVEGVRELGDRGGDLGVSACDTGAASFARRKVRARNNSVM